MINSCLEQRQRQHHAAAARPHPRLGQGHPVRRVCLQGASAEHGRLVRLLRQGSRAVRLGGGLLRGLERAQPGHRLGGRLLLRRAGFFGAQVETDYLPMLQSAYDAIKQIRQPGFIVICGSLSQRRRRQPRRGLRPLQPMLFDDVNRPGQDVSMRIHSSQGIIAERPMYFNYQGAWTGGHDVVGATAPQRQWLFAEGYTGDGFDEWLCLQNPNDATVDRHRHLHLRRRLRAHEQELHAGSQQPLHHQGQRRGGGGPGRLHQGDHPGGLAHRGRTPHVLQLPGRLDRRPQRPGRQRRPAPVVLRRGLHRRRLRRVALPDEPQRRWRRAPR